MVVPFKLFLPVDLSLLLSGLLKGHLILTCSLRKWESTSKICKNKLKLKWNSSLKDNKMIKDNKKKNTIW